MKTNQIMVRQMGMFSVNQRTKDSMFDATALLKQWNESSGEKKEVTKFFENEGTKAFIDALMVEEDLNTQKSAYLKTRGKNGGTWMHPILFIKFAMWLNPRFEVQVIKFVYDQMIKFRNDAGDANKTLASAVQMLVGKDKMDKAISDISIAINFCVYNRHEKGIRNQEASEAKVRELFDLIKKLYELIDEGFIKTYDEAIVYLRKVWQKKWLPKVLQTK